MTKPFRVSLVEFPAVVIHAPEGSVKQHVDYPAAKGGDIGAADRLVAAFLNADAVAQLRSWREQEEFTLVPVHALEATGVNEIPAALAKALSSALDCPILDSVIQDNTVGHTGADGFHRLANQALFSGEVPLQTCFLMVDDFVGQGGTLANLHGYLRQNAARVLGATVLTGKPYSARLSLDADTLAALRSKHGQDLEEWWQQEFGFGFDELTRSEARYLEKSADADFIRKRIAAARFEAGH